MSLNTVQNSLSLRGINNNNNNNTKVVASNSQQDSSRDLTNYNPRHSTSFNEHHNCLTTNEGKLEQELISYLRRAFRCIREGSSEKYQELHRTLYNLSAQPTNRQKLLFYSLSHSVSDIRTEDKDLFLAIFRFEWHFTDFDVLMGFKDFILNLVSKMEFLPTVLFHLVECFLPPKQCIDEEEIQKQTEHRAHVAHTLIKEIVNSFPSSSQKLNEALKAHYPTIYAPTIVHKFYVRNLLSMTQYLGRLSDQIVLLIISQIINIDVSIKVDDDIAFPEVDENMFRFEEEDSDIDDQDNTENENENEDEMAERLDSLLEIVFSFIRKIGQSHVECIQNSSDEGPCDGLFKTMLRAFESYILNTHRSKCTQFTIFYICSFDPAYSAAFLQFLLNRVFNPGLSTVARQSCAAYLASFLARASFLTKHQVQYILEQLVGWIHTYSETFESTVTFPDAERHCVYYSICQIVFYALCFRDTLLLDTEEDRQFIHNLNLPAIIESRFNPFRIILQSVVREFARIAYKWGIVDCFPILENNKRTPLPSYTSFGGPNNLETFFPFDPFLLEQSHSFIEPLYQQWKHADGDELENTDLGINIPEKFDEQGRAMANSFEMDLSGSLNSQLSLNSHSDSDEQGFPEELEADFRYHAQQRKTALF